MEQHNPPGDSLAMGTTAVKAACIVQARMGSTRLRGKVLSDLDGQPLLARLVNRLRRCQLIDDVVIATTRNTEDDAIIDLARRLDSRWHRGSASDVLARYVGAARESGADLIVRVTADCPLLDPAVADRVVAAIARHTEGCDYASNVVHRSFPRGLDVEAFWSDTLDRMDRLAVTPAAREHVTTYLRWERPELFLTADVIADMDHSDLRWTVDTIDDLCHVQMLWREFDVATLGYRELAAAIRARGLARFDAAHSPRAVV